MNENFNRKHFLTKSIHKLFSDINLDIKGLRVLDVGCSRGYHADIMRQMGADVWVNDIDRSRLVEKFEPDKIIECKIGDIPLQHHGKFDIVTAFRVFLHNSNENDFYRGVAKALKPDGKSIIGMDEGFDIRSHNNTIDFNFKEKRTIYEETESNMQSANLLQLENQYIYLISGPRYISKNFLPPK